MNKVHLQYLLNIGDTDQGYVGTNALNWANQVLPNNQFDKILNKQFNRYELLDYCNNKKNSDLEVLVAILAWGGMRRDHGRLLLNNNYAIRDLVKKLRNKDYVNRKVAFNAFHLERKKVQLAGLGIGYFTKLICFLSPDLNGYIMDQWVSKSINLLWDKKIVHITKYNWVSDENNGETYEKFCSLIDELATILNDTGFNTEKRLFSVGRNKGKWRNYLIENYKL